MQWTEWTCQMVVIYTSRSSHFCIHVNFRQPKIVKIVVIICGVNDSALSISLRDGPSPVGEYICFRGSTPSRTTPTGWLDKPLTMCIIVYLGLLVHTLLCASGLSLFCWTVFATVIMINSHGCCRLLDIKSKAD